MAHINAVVEVTALRAIGTYETAHPHVLPDPTVSPGIPVGTPACDRRMTQISTTDIRRANPFNGEAELVLEVEFAFGLPSD